jgi:hypothetical protein
MGYFHVPRAVTISEKDQGIELEHRNFLRNHKVAEWQSQQESHGSGSKIRSELQKNEADL